MSPSPDLLVTTTTLVNDTRVVPAVSDWTLLLALVAVMVVGLAYVVLARHPE